MDPRANLEDFGALNPDVIVRHTFDLDGQDVEIAEDRYGNLYVRSVGVQSWLHCVGLEAALAREILDLLDENSRIHEHLGVDIPETP